MARDRGPLDVDALFQRVDHATRTNPRQALSLVEMAWAQLSRGPAAGRSRVEARLLRYRGHARRALNDFQGSLNDYGRAIARFRRLGDAFEAAVTQIGRIHSLMYRARYADALAAARQARRVFVRRGDRARVARLDTNTANILHRWDRPAQALRCYDRARAVFVRLRDAGATALVDVNRGNVLAGLGRLDEAEAAYRSARSVFTSLGQELATAEADYGIAYTLFLQARLTEALEAFEELRPRLARLGERRLSALCDMDSAETYLRLNLRVEAEERARRAAATFRSLEMRYEEARSLAFAGTALLESGRPERALAAWRQAGRLFEREKNRAWTGIIRLNMARLERSRGRLDAALRHASAARSFLRPSLLPDRHAEALYLIGLLRAERAFPARGATDGSARAMAGGAARAAAPARRILLQARAGAAAARASWLVRDAEEALGELARRRGTRAEARRHFQAAVAAGERLRSLLRGDDFRAAFFRDRARPYLALAFLDLDAGRVEQAFAWLERGRSRALLEGLQNLPGRRPRHGAGRAEAHELETVLRRLAAQYQFDAGPEAPGARPSPGTARLPDPVRRHLESRAEQLIGRVYPECTGSRPRVGGPRGGAAGVSTTDLRLGADEALVSYCELDGAITAFVRTRDRLSVATDLASTADVAAAADRLSYQWGRFRLGAELLERHGRLLLADALEDLGLLHGLLVQPLAGARARSTWIVIPSRSMASLPLAALHDGRRYLAESTRLAVAPSAGVFARCRQRLARRASGTLLVGQTGRATPEVAREIAAIRRAAPRRPVSCLSGREATVEALVREAPGRALIHLASHGFFHAERPRLSGIRLADRWFHAHDAARLDLSAELVVLSACQSGSSLVLEGDEWMGLPGAVLRAGAARVLAGLWDVDDAATRRLMTLFAGAWARGGGSPAEALRRAQAALLAGGRHPYFWAGFQIVGTP